MMLIDCSSAAEYCRLLSRANLTSETVTVMAVGNLWILGVIFDPKDFPPKKPKNFCFFAHICTWKQEWTDLGGVMWLLQGARFPVVCKRSVLTQHAGCIFMKSWLQNSKPPRGTCQFKVKSSPASGLQIDYEASSPQPCVLLTSRCLLLQRGNARLFRTSS